jgi:hypothetical protein
MSKSKLTHPIDKKAGIHLRLDAPPAVGKMLRVGVGEASREASAWAEAFALAKASPLALQSGCTNESDREFFLIPTPQSLATDR